MKRLRYFVWWLRPKWWSCQGHGRSLCGWSFEWGPLTIWNERRYYRTTGYFVSWGNDSHWWHWEWRFRDFEPTPEARRALDESNWQAMQENKAEAQAEANQKEKDPSP